MFPELVSNRRIADTAPKAEPGITGCGTPVGGMGNYGSRVTKDKRQTGMNGTAKKYEIGRAGEGGHHDYGDKDLILKDFRSKRERQRKKTIGMRGEEPKTSPGGWRLEEAAAEFGASCWTAG